MAEMLERRRMPRRVLSDSGRGPVGVILAIRQMTKPGDRFDRRTRPSGAGFNLALSCDLRIAIANRNLQPSLFVKLGFSSGLGAEQYFLPRMVTSNIAV